MQYVSIPIFVHIRISFIPAYIYIHIFIHVSMCLSLHMHVYCSKHLEEFPSSKQDLSSREAIRGLCNLNNGVLTGIYQGEIQRSTKFPVFFVDSPQYQNRTKASEYFHDEKKQHTQISSTFAIKTSCFSKDLKFFLFCCPIMFDSLVVFLPIYICHLSRIVTLKFWTIRKFFFSCNPGPIFDCLGLRRWHGTLVSGDPE